MAETVDLTLVLERLNDLMTEVRTLKTDVATIKMHMATRSQFLAITEIFSQFDNHLVTLDARVAMIETRLNQ